MKRAHHSPCLLLAGWVIHLAPSASQAAPAPIVFDGSLGKPGGDLTGSHILANRGVQRGENLFHSFSRFNVNQGETATFQTPANTTNILARVTGGSISKINGSIRTDAPANLYLINPSGILFGHGASVDVAGSFIATTADYLSFRDKNGKESRFWASADGNTTLVSDPPSKFGFLDSGAEGKIEIQLSENPGEITNDGLLSTGSFSAVGREISVTDSLIQFFGGNLDFRTNGNGEVDIASTSAAKPAPNGTGNITFTNSFFESPGKDFSAHSAGDIYLDRTVISSADGFLPGTSGDIQLTSGRDISLTTTSIQKPNFGADPTGSIHIQTEDDIHLTANSAIESSALSSGKGGSISIQSGGKFTIDDFGLISSSTSAEGNGGAIHITSGGKLDVSNFGLILSASTADGNAGSIQIESSKLSIAGKSVWPVGTLGRTTGIQSLAEGSGAGGDIGVQVAGRINIRNTGGIFASTNAGGKSGSIQVKTGALKITGARNYLENESPTLPDNFFITGISIKSARNELTGSLGSIDINVKRSITLQRGGLIDATNFSLNPSASAGGVSVRADSIHADRTGSDYFTGIGSGTVTDLDSGNTGSGSGGTVTVKSSTITLLNGAQIAASSRSGGDAGTIQIETRNLSASGSGRETEFLFTGESGIVAATRGLATGGAGGIQIKQMKGSVPSQIHLKNGAQISARADGSGGGGSVKIDFRDGYVSLDSASSINARSGELGGNAGSVFVSAAQLSLRNRASISSTNASPSIIGGDAGSVRLRPQNLDIHGGRLEVSASGGNAGSINIEGGKLLDFRNAKVVAEAFRNGGDLFIEKSNHVLLDGSRISANAKRGNGGNIGLSADVILNNGSQITASSQFGTDGIVRVEPQTTLSGAEDQADPEPLNATDALQPECTNRIATEAGSFIQAGRGSTPRLPGGYMPSIRLHRTAALEKKGR